MAKRSSNVVMTIKAETGLSRSWSGEWEGKWMDLSLAAGSMNRNIMWPKCLSTDNNIMCAPPQYFSHSALSESGCLFLFLSPLKKQEKAGLNRWAQQGVATACVSTPPTQSCSCPVFLDGEAITVVLGGTFKQKSRCECVIWFHYLIPADQLTIWVHVLVSLSLFIFQLPTLEGCPCVDLWNNQFRLDEL